MKYSLVIASLFTLQQNCKGMKVTAANYSTAQVKQDKDTLFSQAKNQLIANLWDQNEQQLEQSPSRSIKFLGSGKDCSNSIVCPKFDENYSISYTTVTKPSYKKSTVNTIQFTISGGALDDTCRTERKNLEDWYTKLSQIEFQDKNYEKKLLKAWKKKQESQGACVIVKKEKKSKKYKKKCKGKSCCFDDDEDDDCLNCGDFGGSKCGVCKDGSNGWGDETGWDSCKKCDNDWDDKCGCDWDDKCDNIDDGITGTCPLGFYNPNIAGLNLCNGDAKDLLGNPNLLQYVCAVDGCLTKDEKPAVVSMCKPIPGYYGPKFDPLTFGKTKDVIPPETIASFLAAQLAYTRCTYKSQMENDCVNSKKLQSQLRDLDDTLDTGFKYLKKNKCA